MNKTRHFILDTDNETNLCTVNWFAFSNGLNLKNEKGLRTWLNTKDGVSFTHQWPADARIQAIGKIKKPGVMLGNDDNVLLVNDELKTVIADICKDVAIEFLPFSVVDLKEKVIGENYYVVNPLGTYNALDLMASEIQWGSDGGIFRIEELILNKKKAENAPPIFRLQHTPNNILIGYSLAFAMHERKFDIWWSELSYSNPAQIKQKSGNTKLPETDSYEQLSISHQLVNAVKDGHTQKVAELLEKKSLLNLFDNPKHGSTALMYAAKKKNIPLLKMLIEAGAALDICDNENRTALYFAVQENAEACVSELLRAGANPNIGRTEFLNSKKIIGSPLDTAIFLNHRVIIRLLLDHKADPNLKDHQGKIPFHSAKDEEVFRWLIEAGADINATSKSFNPPFHMVAAGGSLSLLQLAIEKGGKINSTGYQHSTPLMYAAANGNLDNVKSLLAQGADPELTDKRGKTAIQYAFENKQFKIVNYLAEQGVYADEKLLKRLKHLQKGRAEFASDLYAKDVSDYIFSILSKTGNKLKFEPTRLQVNFDKDWQLEWFTLSGKTDKQVFTYHLSVDDVDAPAGYTVDNKKKLLAPFLRKFNLNKKDVLPDPLLSWQLYKTIHTQLQGGDTKSVELLLVHDQYNISHNLSSIHHSILSGLSAISEQPVLLQEYASLCLKQETEQESFVQIFNTRPNTYAFDSIMTSITESAVANVLLQKEEINQPVSRITLQYADFGAMLPSYIRLQFKKGKARTWSLDWPASALPTHIDDFPKEDYLLPAFIKKNRLDENIPGWGDIYQIPDALLRLECMLAGQQIIHLLKENGISFTASASAYIGDGEDDSDDLPGYLSMVQKEIREKLADANLIQAFAAMCYQTPAKQQWFQDLRDK